MIEPSVKTCRQSTTLIICTQQQQEQVVLPLCLSSQDLSVSRDVACRCVPAETAAANERAHGNPIGEHAKDISYPPHSAPSMCARCCAALTPAVTCTHVTRYHSYSTPMHPQAPAPACSLDIDSAGAPLQHAALSARSQAFVHSNASEVIKLYMAPPHASASSCSGRSRVRPRPGHPARTPWRTLLVPVGGAETRPFSVETKLASAVMAGDDSIEQLSRMMTNRGAAASTAWGLGQSSSSNSAGSRGSSSDRRDKRQPQRRRTQRSGEGKVVESDSAAEESSNGGAGTATAAAATSVRRGKKVSEPARLPTT